MRINEVFSRVRINLLGLLGSSLDDIKLAEAHLVLLPQAAIFLEKNGIRGVGVVDSAGAAAALVKSERKGVGILASKLAAKIYGLDILAENIEDLNHNTTRFLLLSPNPHKTR